VAKALFFLLALVGIAAGCDPGSPGSTPRATVAETPPGDSREPDCPNQDAVTSDPGAVRSGTLVGDVDGDGSDDTMFLAVDVDSPVGCQAFLVADIGGGTLAEEISDPDISFDLGLPTLDGLIEVDGRSGAEVSVRILTGASTLFVGLFTVIDGELERVEVAGESEYGNLFPSGGSVGHLEGSDCAEDGIVVTLALPKERGYEVTRSFYTLDDARAEPGERDVGYVWPRNLDKFPELAGPPFSHCGAEE
jgi:hypothetical protein